MEKKTSKDVHKANLHALISCVDALHKLYNNMDQEKKAKGWPLTKALNAEV